MKITLQLFLIAFISTSAFAQTPAVAPQHTAIIWRGFSQQWTYNHRWNRIGDYVQYDNGQGKSVSVHTSATGTGDDVTTFHSYYTQISSPDIFFKEGHKKVLIRGGQDKLNQATTTISVPLKAGEDWFRNKQRYVIYLNGFDLQSKHKADQVSYFGINLANGEYNSGTDSIDFELTYGANMACKTLECPSLGLPTKANRVDYTLTVYYLVAAYNETDANNNPLVEETIYPSHHIYPFGTTLQTPNNSVETNIKGRSDNSYVQGAFGIQSIVINLSQSLWLLELDSYIDDESTYDQLNGTFRAHHNLTYVEWSEGMNASPIDKFKSFWAIRKSGTASLWSNLVLLQLNHATLTNASTPQNDKDNKMSWGGDNESADGSNSAKTAYIFGSAPASK